MAIRIHSVDGAAVAIGLAFVLAGGCGRTIEEDDPPELVEHRIEPCRQFCSAMLSLECGVAEENRHGRTIEGCIEECAAPEPGGWEWARQPDGTDACAPEWFAMATCFDELSCEEQRSYFQRPWGSEQYPCKAEIMAKIRCFDSTPSLEKVEESDS